MENHSQNNHLLLPRFDALEDQISLKMGMSEFNEKNELNMTIFYNDEEKNRNHINCKMRPREIDGIDGGEIHVIFNFKNKLVAYNISKKTAVADLLAFVLHSMELSDSNSDSSVKSNELYRNSAALNQSNSTVQSLDIIESTVTLETLLEKAKGNELVAVRNSFNQLCALISNSKNADISKANEDILIVLDLVSEKIKRIIAENSNNNKNCYSNEHLAEYTNESVEQVFQNAKNWQELGWELDHKVFKEFMIELYRIINNLLQKMQVDLSENDKCFIQDSAIFFNKIKEMRA
jgi:hypothetical protein